MKKEDNTAEYTQLNFNTNPHIDNFEKANQEYLDSIDPVELARAKEMFSKIVIDVENPFEDFVQNVKAYSEECDYHEGIDDSGEVSEDNI